MQLWENNLFSLDDDIDDYIPFNINHPDYPEAHNNLGTVFQDMDKYQEAKSCYQHAIKLNPQYEEGHCNLGMFIIKICILQIKKTRRK